MLNSSSQCSANPNQQHNGVLFHFLNQCEERNLLSNWLRSAGGENYGDKIPNVGNLDVW